MKENHGGVFPVYKQISEEGPSNNRTFTMSVLSYDEKHIVGTGTDKTKKKAEQIASKQALIYYNVIKSD